MENWKEKLKPIKKEIEEKELGASDPRLAELFEERKVIVSVLEELKQCELDDEVEEAIEEMEECLREKDVHIKWGKKGTFRDEEGRYVSRKHNKVITREGLANTGRVDYAQERYGLSNWASYILYKEDSDGREEAEKAVRQAHKRLKKKILKEKLDNNEFILHTDDIDETDFEKEVDHKKFIHDRNGKIKAYKETARK
jgi:hypothetical protein